MLVGRSVARMPETVFGGCGRAGVEEIMGSWIPFGGPGSGVNMLLGSRTATRDVWSRAVFRMPLAGRRGPVGLRAGSCRGAWWFENWIVDASNAGFFHPACFIAISPGSFLESGFEIDRFVIIFLQCDDLSSGVESYYRVFRGVCRPEGRMVDALADSTDEGRLRMR